MREAAWVLGVSLVIISGCGSSEEDEFTYGEGDMQALVVGKWSGAWRNTPDSTARFTLDITRPASPDARASCASRTFSTSSVTEGPGQRVACAPSSSMNLEAALTVDDGSLEPASLTGDLSIYGVELKSAYLSLRDEVLNLQAIYDSGGSWHECFATDPPGPSPGGTIAECTIEERAP